MLNVKDYILEMAFGLDKLENKVTDLSEPIVVHLIKLLVFKDDLNKKKHIKDIDNWLLKIERYKPKTNRKLLVTRYPKWIILDWLVDVNQVEKTIDLTLSNYHGLERLRTPEQTYNIILAMASDLGKDVALRNFTTIEDYIL